MARTFELNNSKRRASIGLAVLLLAGAANAQSHQKPSFDPELKQCETLAKSADDALSSRTHSSSELNDLDWKMSVCVGKFVPLKPTGVPLILYSHGNVADEIQIRMAKAIRTLPLEEQAKFWSAFNANPHKRQ